ncbi:hypothetical protein VKT23_017395 [Stygiomarasmius scandens]|uniref:Uncharacterized protein n=1 Tax=Marasmiellus scandens TaxID=2682957 RepID=A0ABR1IS84_9AGAR
MDLSFLFLPIPMIHVSPYIHVPFSHFLHSLGRRSPSPRARELRRQEERQDNLPPPTHSGKRDRPSRFAPPVASGSVASDPWVPDEFAEPTTSAPPTSHHEHANRDRSRGRDLPEGHQDIVRAQPSSVSRNMYDDTAVTSSSHPSVHVSEPSQPPASHRKRAPLPPQSMHFREVSKSSGRGRADVVPSEATAAAYHGPSPIATSNANAHPSPVSAHGSDLPPPRGHGDRDRGLVRDLPPHQMQMLPQNQSQNQHPRASKFGPPVPSSSSQKVEHDVPPHYDQQVRDGRRDRDRDRDRERDTRDEGRERGRGRDRDRGERRDKRRDRDVSAADEPSSPATSSSLRHPPPSQSQTRLPSAPLHGNAVATSNRNRSRSVSADPSIRAGSGMYADRELVPVGISMPVQDVPLSMPVPTPTQTSASAPKGPRAHGHVPTSPSTNMYPPRRGRSPSHMSMVPHRDDRYDQPPPQMRDGPRSWKEEMMVERGGHRGRGRGRGMGRGGPPLPLSGTNNIPVGARHGHGHGPGPAPNNYNEMPPPPSGLSSVNMMPVKNVRSRFSSGHEPTEAGEPSGHSYSGPKGVYPPEQEVSEHGRHAPSVYEREEDDRRGGRPRRQSFTHEDTRQRSFYPDDEPHPQRRWGAPQDDRYNSTEDPRSPTPPPASREPSYNDNWEPNADYGHGRRRHKNPPAHRHDEADLVENTHAFEPPSPSNGHENGHRPHGLPMKPTTRPPSDIPDDRRRHRRSSIAGSDGHWEHSPVEHRRRPDSPHHHSSIDVADRPVLEEPLSSMRSSKPVKIRRPPPEPSYSNYDRDRERDLPPHNGSTMADDDVVMDDVGPSANPGSGNGRRPSNTRRGGSLLDRLSGVGNDTPSLKDRVNVPSKRDRDQMSVDDGRYPREVGDQVSVGTGEEGSSKRAKKRHAKPKRGRGRGGGGGGGGGAVYT